MFLRVAFVSLLLSVPAFAQRGGGSSDRPPKPKVIAIPTPTPAVPAVPAKPIRRRPPAKVDVAKAAVEAYMPKVKAAFSARWVEALTPVGKEFTPGKVSVLFTLDPEGKLTEVAITENTSNMAFAKFCEQFVRDTAFEKPPEKALVAGSLEIPFTFSIY